MLLLVLDWLFGLVRRAEIALRTFLSQEWGEATAAVAVISLVGSATVLITTSATTTGISLDSLVDTVQGGINRVSATIELRSSVIARSTDSRHVDHIEFTVALFGEGSVPLGGEEAEEHLRISYRDDSTYIPDVSFIASFIGGNGDGSLDRGEIASLTVDLSQLPEVDLEANERFTLELMAPIGGTAEVSRTLPFILQPVMSLH